MLASFNDKFDKKHEELAGFYENSSSFNENFDKKHEVLFISQQWHSAS